MKLRSSLKAINIKLTSKKAKQWLKLGDKFILLHMPRKKSSNQSFFFLKTKSLHRWYQQVTSIFSFIATTKNVFGCVSLFSILKLLK